jgi:hypothetical protein
MAMRNYVLGSGWTKISGVGFLVSGWMEDQFGQVLCSIFMRLGFLFLKPET